MAEYYPEFFNDVFGPIMQPGSSSHTAGPCRLGCMAHKLLTAPLKHILIELDKNGSFAGTFGLMNEDLGMLAGAYGLFPDDKRIFDIRQRSARSWKSKRRQCMRMIVKSYKPHIPDIIMRPGGIMNLTKLPLQVRLLPKRYIMRLEFRR